MHWKTSTIVHANSSGLFFSAATGKGELFGHSRHLMTKSSATTSMELWAKGWALKGRASLLPWTQEVHHHQILTYMINSTLATKKITACSYNENIKMSNVYFAIQTFLVLTEHFSEEVAPSWRAFPLLTLKSRKE